MLLALNLQQPFSEVLTWEPEDVATAEELLRQASEQKG